jgi:phage regulator Rha-like protein
MHELIPSNASAIAMSSREIAELTGKQHLHVMRDIRALLDDLGEGESNFGCTYLDAQGKQRPEFKLPYRETMILVSGYNVQIRTRIIDRWQELESKAAVPAKPTELSRMELLQIAMQAEQEKLALEAKVEEQAPKVEALKRIADADGAFTLTDAAKDVGMRPSDFIQMLADIGWVFRQSKKLHGYAHIIAKGYLWHKLYEYREGKVDSQVLVTPKGIAHLAERVVPQRLAA